MAEESLLQQAFAGAGEQLDRIIDAYERTPTSDPNYPRYVSFTFDNDVPTIYKINEDLSIEVIEGYSGEKGLYYKEESNSIIIMDCFSDMENPDPQLDDKLFSYDKSTFELTDLHGDLENLQWTDLPQS